MSPFSVVISELRRSRSLRQGDFAKAIGYEQSYVSSIEAGTKATPSEAFVLKVKEVLHLNSIENSALDRAIQTSSRKFNLAIDASPQMYELWHEFNHSTLDMEPCQIEILLNILRLINTDNEIELSNPLINGFSEKRIKEVQKKKGQI